MGELFAFAAYAAGPSLKIRLPGFRLSCSFLFTPIFPRANTRCETPFSVRVVVFARLRPPACPGKTHTARDTIAENVIYEYIAVMSGRELSGDESSRAQRRSPFRNLLFENPFSPRGRRRKREPGAHTVNGTKIKKGIGRERTLLPPLVFIPSDSKPTVLYAKKTRFRSDARRSI